MGCYAEAIRARFPGAEEAPDLPVDTGWVVLTASDPDPLALRRQFAAPPRLLVITGAEPRPDTADVQVRRFVAGFPPRLDEPARQALEGGGYGAAVLLDGVAGSSGRILWELARQGVRTVAWRDGAGWTRAPIAAALWRKPVARLERGLRNSRAGRWVRRRLARARAHDELSRRNAQAWLGETEWAAHLERVGRVERPRTGRQLDVLLYIGQLNSGGAERQCVNLATGLQRRGHRVRVLTTYPLSDENAHYCDHLRRAGVRFGVAGGGAQAAPEVGPALDALALDPEVVGALPEVVRDPVLDLAGELLAEPPDVLHCWLDYPNIIGAAAAALTGTPVAVLSTRNLNPTYFPAFYQSWMDDWYERLVDLPQVHLLGNSTQGAADYAAWMDVPIERFDVIYNGVDLAAMTDPAPAAVARVRRELDLAPGQPLVVGVFRLAQEKQPLLFVDVVARVYRRRPDLRVAMVGIGDRRDEVVEALVRRGLTRVVTLLGQRKDVPAILHAADVKLLTSKVEGTPNVILEAQWAGCPPVATRGGGTPDALVDGVTGFLHDLDDAAGLARSVLGLLDDPVRRDEMGRAGRRFVGERFGLEPMVDAHLAYYESLLGPPPPEALAAVPGPAARPTPVEAPVTPARAPGAAAPEEALS